MRSCVICICSVGFFMVLIGPPAQGDEQPPQRLTLERSVAEAFARNPGLKARRAVVEQGEGRLITAKTYPYNPELTVEAARRSSGRVSVIDRGLAVTQEVEIAGQRGLRIDEMASELDASRAQFRREEERLAADVRVAFVEALRARELLAVERANADLIRNLAEIARKRFDSGAIAQMEVNLAQVQVGRAERARYMAEGRYAVARSVLAGVVGLDPSAPPEPEGQLELPAEGLPALSLLISGAFERRSDLRAFRENTEAARVRIELARRDAVPNLTFGAFVGQEDGVDRIAGGAIGIRIPLFNRNRGTIATADASHRQAVADTDTLELRVRQDVAAALARLRSATAATSTLQEQVLGTLVESLGLLQRSFEVGKVDWTQVLVFRREFVEAQRDYIDTITDAQLAATELDLAAGIRRQSAAMEARP